ncbi:alpha-tocopherol transfer protein-like [Papilio machaon]|uniref:alpha-tocopherol transfer protein-like n=1 Tax=Papilio machaon TaxID=76193 RepID=UPI001E664C1E|nr:alpha-tocopherol transfer protein-like [Papilio machaon]
MIRELSPELAHIAKTELNEDPKQTPEDIKHLREWIIKQTHLKARTDDQWLVAMLRGCKFSLERVKEKLDLYYTLRTTSPEVTLRLKPTQPTFINFLRLGTCIILPKAKTGLHPRVILIRAGRYDPEKNSVADIMCILYYMVQILVMEDDSATVIGTKIVVDYEGTTLNHLVQANVTLLRKIVAVSQDSLPLRLKGSHHLNVPSGIETIFKLVSAFISEKAKQRLKIHKSTDELFEHIPKDVMPPEYGGTGATVAENIEYWIAKIKEYKSWMEVEERLGTDESRRLGALPSDVAGDKGSFRQLNID